MPGRDRTGPMGTGPLTGGGFGGCAGYAPGGRGLRAWGGRGWRNRFYATGLPGWAAGPWQGPSPEEEAAFLRNQAASHQSALEQIEARLKDLEEGQSE